MFLRNSSGSYPCHILDFFYVNNRVDADTAKGHGLAFWLPHLKRHVSCLSRRAAAASCPASLLYESAVRWTGSVSTTLIHPDLPIVNHDILSYQFHWKRSASNDYLERRNQVSYSSTFLRFFCSHALVYYAVSIS